MKKIILLLTVSLGLAGAVSTQAQSNIEYTLTGTLSGLYNGTAFADQAFTLSISAPGTSIGLLGDDVTYGVGSFNASEASDIILTVAGVGTSTFLAPNTGFFNNQRVSVAGFGFPGDFCDFQASEFATYQLGDYMASTPVDMFYYTDFSAGADNWTSLKYSGTVFQAGVAPVPEPATLALAGLGGFAMLWQLRRRK